MLDHVLPDHLRRELLVAQAPTEHLAEDGHQLLVGERLRASQLQPSAPSGLEVVAAQRVGGDRGQVPFVDQRLGEAGVGVADDVARADLGAPGPQGVGREGAGPQAHPRKAAGDGGVLDLLVPVPLVAGWLLVQGIVDVRRRQGHHPLHSPMAGQRHQLDGGEPDGARVQEQGGDALQVGRNRGGPRQVALDDLDLGGQGGGLRAVGDDADLGTLVDEDVDQGASDGAGRAGD